MNIVFVGAFEDASGYAVGARGYLKSLDHHITKNNLDVNLKIHTLKNERENKDNYNQEEANLIEKYEIKHLTDSEYEKFLENDYILLLFQPVTYFEYYEEYTNPRYQMVSHHFVADRLIKNANKIVAASCWETDKFPDLWKQIWDDNSIDRMIVPSTFNEKIFSKTIECSLGPYLIEETETNTKLTKQDDKFTILSLFQWTYRKAPELLIVAYTMEFQDHDDVQLLIKAYSSIMVSSTSLEEQEKHLTAAINDVVLTIPSTPGETNPRVLLTCDMMSSERIYELYRDVDLFALASRGEGFGLPIAEALINKTPVLVSAEGGHTDFIDPQAAFFVEGHWTPCRHCPPGGGYHYNQNMFEPHILSMRKQLRNAYNLWKSGKLSAKGKKGYNYIKRSGYDRATIGKKLVDILKEEYETINA